MARKAGWDGAALGGILLAAVTATPAGSVPLPAPRPPAIALQPVAPPQASEPAQPKSPASSTSAAVPLPTPRPPALARSATPEITPSPPRGIPREDAPPPSDPDCAVLASLKQAEFERLAPIRQGQCGAENPVRLDAVTLASGERLELQPGVTMRCATAIAFVTWVREDIQPKAKSLLGGPITATRNTGDLECRGRNRQAGAKLSEHGRANAIDVHAFRKSDGSWLEVSQPGGDQAFLDHARQQACARFTTVLGPGSDRYHWNHLHMDLARRGKSGDGRYCR